MRQIKFRAKPCYMGGNQPAWVYGTFQYIAQRRVRTGATDNGMLVPRNDKGRIVDLYGTETEVLCDTVGQFTGLTDKNGKEIYEGDVIESNSIRHVVKYMEKGALFAGVSTSIKDTMTGDYAVAPLFQHWIDGWGKEVIGNIHDNPELLKQTTNQTN